MNDAVAAELTSDPTGRRAVYLTKAADIVPMLKILRNHSADLELRLSGVEEVYTGRILDIQNDHFLLEDVRPRDGIVHLRRGARFSFAARVDDLYICGEDCKVTKVDSERGLPYFRAQLPDQLLRHRRRRHTRVTLPPRVSPMEGSISLNRPQQPDGALNGHIIDVSVGGCRAEFKGAVLPALRTDEELPHCTVRLTNSLSVVASGVVRHSAWDARQKLTSCGIEFTDMAIADRRRLEHYVLQLANRTAAARP